MDDSSAPVGAAATPPPTSRNPTRPDWLESTKHTRRRLPRRAPREERPPHNPWIGFAVAAVVVVVAAGVVAVLVQRWLERPLVVVPETVAGMPRSSDAQMLAFAQRIRDEEQRDPKYAASRFETAAYGDDGHNAVVIYVPQGAYLADQDLESLAASSQDMTFTRPEVVDGAHCVSGTPASGTDAGEVRESYCYRSSKDYTVIAITVPDDGSLGALVTADALGAQS